MCQKLIHINIERAQLNWAPLSRRQYLGTKKNADKRNHLAVNCSLKKCIIFLRNRITQIIEFHTTDTGTLHYADFYQPNTGASFVSAEIPGHRRIFKQASWIVEE